MTPHIMLPRVLEEQLGLHLELHQELTCMSYDSSQLFSCSALERRFIISFSSFNASRVSITRHISIPCPVQAYVVGLDDTRTFAIIPETGILTGLPQP
jgi:hypothetical protein